MLGINGLRFDHQVKASKSPIETPRSSKSHEKKPGMTATKTLGNNSQLLLKRISKSNDAFLVTSLVQLYGMQNWNNEIWMKCVFHVVAKIRG